MHSNKMKLCWFELQLQLGIQQKANDYHSKKNRASLYREKNICQLYSKRFTLNECLDWNGVRGFIQWKYTSLRVEYYRLYHRWPMGAFFSTSNVAFARCRRSKTDSGFHGVDSTLCQWNLDSSRKDFPYSGMRDEMFCLTKQVEGLISRQFQLQFQLPMKTPHAGVRVPQWVMGFANGEQRRKNRTRRQTWLDVRA